MQILLSGTAAKSTTKLSKRCCFLLSHFHLLKRSHISKYLLLSGTANLWQRNRNEIQRQSYLKHHMIMLVHCIFISPTRQNCGATGMKRVACCSIPFSYLILAPNFPSRFTTESPAILKRTSPSLRIISFTATSNKHPRMFVRQVALKGPFTELSHFKRLLVLHHPVDGRAIPVCSPLSSLSIGYF